MEAIIYLVRHGKTDKKNWVKNDNEIQESNALDLAESFIPKIEEASKKLGLYEIENVYSSNFLRARRTAKILCPNSDVKIDNRLGERVGGTPNIDITPQEYYKRQMDDIHYKFPDGESVYEIMTRMYDAISDILKECSGSEALVVSHGAAITFLLKKWCNVEVIDVPNKIRRFEFKGNVIHEGVVNFVQCFKLTFDDNNLKDIQVIN